MGASLSGSRPIIRSPSSWKRQPSSRPSHANAARAAPPEEASKPPKSWVSTPVCACATRLIPDWELPVYIANFILMDYGTGAIFGCPAHDERDFEFATKYDLPIISTYLPSEEAAESDEAYVPAKTEKVFYNRGFAGEQWQTAKRRSTPPLHFCEGQGVGQGVTKYRLRDWGLVPPTLLGCPIPVVHCDACGVVPEKKENLPVELPFDVNSTRPATRWTATRHGATVLARLAARLPSAKPTRWTPSWTVRGISRASPHRAPTRPPIWRTPPIG